MGLNDIFSRRIRWVAIATGVAASLALFPALLLFEPALMVVGGIIQSRFPRAGKWFIWAGAAELMVVLTTYDVLLFPHPLVDHLYWTLTFSGSTILVIWCCAELVINGLKRMHARRSMTPAELSPVTKVEWIVAIVITVLSCWRAVETARAFDHSNSLSTLGVPLVQAVIVVAFDISLMRRVSL